MGALAAAALLAGCASAGRPRSDARDERYAQAWLRQLLTLQRTYYAMHERYAASADELREVGWDWPGNARAYPWMVHHGRRLCVAVLPRNGARGTWSVDAAGQFHPGPYCGRLW